MADKIQIRRDTAANWSTQNPVLSQGELGAETDTSKIKMGDASSTWNQLGYLIDTGSYATSTQVQTAINDLVDSAPGALDTLNELAAALGDDPDFATTVTNAIATKATTSTLSAVATSGAYGDLTGTPTLSGVATSGDYTDLSNKPTIPAAYGDSDVSAYLAANDFGTSTSVIASITDSAPATLDTLNELAAALGDDANFSTTVTSSIATKANSADLSAVATSGAYGDLTGTPTLSGVATSGAYADLSGTPTIPSALTDVGVTDGTSGQFLTTNGAGTFSFADAAGGGGGSFEAVASGALANGDKVLVNADGTVSVVAPIPNPAGPGTIETFTTNPSWMSSTFDSNSNKVVIVYEDVDNNEYGTAVVGTVSGSTISFGSPVVFENSGSIAYSQVVFDSNSNKVVANYVLNNSSAKAVVGTVSGTSISFGSPVTYAGSRHGNNRVAFDANANKIAIVYQNNSNSGYGTVVIGDVSGTSISFGSPTVFNSANSDQPRVAFDANANKIAIQYKNFGNSYYLEAIVGTISGTSVSFGSSTTFESTNSETGDVVFDPDSNKVIYSYKPGGAYEGKAIVGTISGTSISFGSPAVFQTNPGGFNAPSGMSNAYDSSANKVLVGYNISSQGVFVAVGTVSGTSISFDTPVLIDANGGSNIDLAYDSNSNKPVISYRSSASGEGKAVTLQTVAGADTYDLTAENYVGISDAAYSDGATATIQSAGAVDDAQSGLTAGQAYFLNEDGTLSTTAGDPSVFAGTALSATQLMIGKSPEIVSYSDSDVASYLSSNDYATATATIATITDSAPGTLDTLNELAAALGDDANFSTTVTNSIALKANSADLSAVATSGAYSDLSGTPTIPSDLTDVGITDGTIGQVLTTNGSGTFTFADAAAGGGSFEAVASGNLSNGDPVIVNADGTVSMPALGSASGSTGQYNQIHDHTDNAAKMVTDRDTGKVIAIYVDTDNNYYPTVKIGSISGDTITFGAATVIRSSRSGIAGIVSMDGGKFVVKLQESNFAGGGYYDILAVCTISGTTVTTGSLTNESDQNGTQAMIFDPQSGQIADVYHSGSGYYKIRIITVSGTTASGQAYGNGAQLSTRQYAQGFSVAYDPVNYQHFLTYHTLDSGNWQSWVSTVSVSGGSASVDSEVEVTDVTTSKKMIAYDTTNNKLLMLFNDTSNNKRFMVGTISGSSVSFGDRVTYTPTVGGSNMHLRLAGGMTYVPDIEKFVAVIDLRDDSSDTYRSHAIFITLSDSDTLSFGSPFTVTADDTQTVYASPVSYTSGTAIISYAQSDLNTTQGVSVLNFIPPSTTLTASNYVGIVDAAYSNGATATIQIVGSVDDAQSGLTAGQGYYVQGDGTLATTADSPSVFAGVAVSATKLLIKDS